MPTGLPGGPPGGLSLLKHLIQWRYNKVTFMLAFDSCLSAITRPHGIIYLRRLHPGSGHLVSLFGLAAEMGLLHLLLPEVGEPEGRGSEQAARERN